MRNPIKLSGGGLVVGVWLLGAGCVVAQPPPPPYYWVEPPGVVEVEPGVAVVPEWHSEVFYSDGWYWTRYQGRWYRGSGRRNGWYVVEVQHVPPRVVGIPPGRYVQWHPPPPAPHPVGPFVPAGPVGYQAGPPGHTVTPVAYPAGPPGHTVTPVAQPAAPPGHAVTPATHPAGHSVTPARHDDEHEEHPHN